MELCKCKNMLQNEPDSTQKSGYRSASRVACLSVSSYAEIQRMFGLLFLLSGRTEMGLPGLFDP